jgi:oligopeptide/dipeptide ABC transporter ATP-binding protein
MVDDLLQVLNLRVGFPIGTVMAEAVRGISFSIQTGEVVGLVGESGSGKSVTAHAIMRLIKLPGRILGGSVCFMGRDLLALGEREIRGVRGREISIVFQDPLTSLNPAFTIGQQLIDVVTVHQDMARPLARKRAAEALRLVGIPLPEKRMKNYPHEFSGGMRQRALIAMAIACQPKLLIADEPTTALDVTIQAQIVALLLELRRELGLSMLFITHNLDLMAEICDRAVVLYDGTVMEDGPVEDLFHRPRHPYTRLLLHCVPRLSDNNYALKVIEGVPPVLGVSTVGCPFEKRCPDSIPVCRMKQPPETCIDRHRVACWMAAT